MIGIYILYLVGVMVNLIIFGYINAESHFIEDDFGLLWIALAFIWPIVWIFTAFILTCGAFYGLGFLIKRGVGKKSKHLNQSNS